MVEIKMQVQDNLAHRLEPMTLWLPTVIELGLIGLKTPAVQTSSEIINFLSTGPTPAEVANYTVSDRAQQRLQRLLALNQSGLLSQDEVNELDEIEQIEHIMIMLKAQAHQQLSGLTNA